MKMPKISRTQGLTNQACYTFYQSLQKLTIVTTTLQMVYKFLMKHIFKPRSNLMPKFWPTQVLMMFIPPYLNFRNNWPWILLSMQLGQPHLLFTYFKLNKCKMITSIIIHQNHACLFKRKLGWLCSISRNSFLFSRNSS